jgi:hypothetical protein
MRLDRRGRKREGGGRDKGGKEVEGKRRLAIKQHNDRWSHIHTIKSSREKRRRKEEEGLKCEEGTLLKLL